jgi:hypothetical protein
MSAKALLYAFFSALLPLLGYAAVFLFVGLAPARLSATRMYAPLLIFNALGLVLSVLALAYSNPRPTDISTKMRVALLTASIGLLANTIAFQMVLMVTVFHTAQA